MRRSASEIIRNLERRVARLERTARQTSNKKSFFLPESEKEKAELHYSLADWFRSNGMKAYCGAPADDSYWCEVDATPEEIMALVGRKLKGRGQFFMYKGMEYGIMSKMGKAHYLRGAVLSSKIHLVDGSSMAMPKRYIK